MRFLIEESLTPIYNRIVNAFASALTDSTHDAIIINPALYSNINEYINAIHKYNVDYCVITNSLSVLSQPSPEKRFLFELIQPKLIFIHHDSLTGHFSGELIEDRISAFLRTKEKCTHFCLEYNDYLNLGALGISNSFPIYHASEFRLEKRPSKYSFDVSFVGHVVPGVDNLFGDTPFSPLVQADYWNRVVRLDKCIEPSAVEFANMSCPGIEYSTNWVSAKYAYISGIHRASQHLRGEVIKRLGSYNIDIFGGDPAYLNKGSRALKIQKHGLHYHQPLQHYAETSNIYASSKINLNITSLHFDNAVINRVIDAGASGGFILTDWKSPAQGYNCSQ